MDAFYRTHNYLLQHTESPVRRLLMDEIDWSQRLIGIKGSRGVGKTTFLLAYAKEAYGINNRECLYINLNHFYFTECTLIDFVSKFRARGGRVLLIDQMFKYPSWSKELRYCYDNFPDVQIVFSGSSVMRLKEENEELSGCVASYNLRGFSFREFLNLMTDNSFPVLSLEEIIAHHVEIAESICKIVKPMAFFPDYVHHGYYPFFLEKRNFSENLLKTMNMTLEVDVLCIKQIEQTYLPKLRKLFYLLTVNASSTPNVSQLSKDIATSRATVMNYIKYMTDARLTNLLYEAGEAFPKKPAKVYLNNPNLMYPIRPMLVNEQAVRETLFYSLLHKGHRLNMGSKGSGFLVDSTYQFKVVETMRARCAGDNLYAVDNTEVGEGNRIPLWLFGFLY